MKAITKYEADDGKIFDSAEAAIKHDAKRISVKKIMRLINPIPDTIDFVTGDGYVQQDALAVQEFKRQILLMGAVHHNKMAEWAKNPIEVHPQSIVGRILSDCDHELYKAWHRVMCIDDSYREWGQPYFAINPDQGKQVEVNNFYGVVRRGQ